ncbi:MAG: methyltransferase domain-containing protein [candidate division WOR-3 bacterium]
MPRRLMNIGESLREHVKPGNHVLCIGPGIPFVDGAPLIASHLVGRRGRVTIMDSQATRRGEKVGTYSEGQSLGDLGKFRTAIKRLEEKGAIKRPDYILGDFRALPIADSSVDAVVEQNLSACLRSGREMKRVLDGYHRVLKPGGVAFIVVNEINPEIVNYRDLRKIMKYSLLGSGFNIVQTKRVSGQSGIDDVPGFKGVTDRSLDLLRKFDRMKKSVGTFVIIAKKQMG